MKVGLSIRIDVTKIDKSRLYKGAKGTYLDLTTFVDLDNQDEYGNNGFISQSVTKEERDAKIKTPILGNSKVIFADVAQSAPAKRPVPVSAPADDFDEDLPF